MPLIDMHDLLQHARRHRYAVAALRVTGTDFLGGVVRAAEDCRAPVVVSLAAPDFECYDPEPLMAAAVAACNRSCAPLALQIDYATGTNIAEAAIRHGCNGVMVHGGRLELYENIALTREIVQLAHACGVPAEGTLGHVPGLADSELQKNEMVYTTPGEAKGFVERTGVDSLAVSVGTVHGHSRRRPKIDYARLRTISENVDVPLSVYGGTGLSDEQLHKMVCLGVTKVGCFTALENAAAAVPQRAHDGALAVYRSRIQGVRQAVRAEAARLIRALGASGRAAEVLAQCKAWRPVHHVMLYDADGAPDIEIEADMAREQSILANMPGVRRVVSAQAVTPETRFRHCCIVELAHEKVMDTWRLSQNRGAIPNSLRAPTGHKVTGTFAHGRTAS